MCLYKNRNYITDPDVFPNNPIVFELSGKTYFEDKEGIVHEVVKVAEVSNSYPENSDANAFLEATLSKWTEAGIIYDFAGYTENGGLIAGWQVLEKR